MKVLKEFGQNVKVFSYEGAKCREENGFPKVVGSYDTVAYGTLERFTIGEKEVIENGQKYVLIAEEYTPGNAHVPARYIAIYAAAEIAADVIQKLNANKYQFETPAIITEDKTVETRYCKTPYTAILDASKNGVIRDDSKEDGYIFAGVENGKVVTQWHSLDVTMELLAKRAIDSL